MKRTQHRKLIAFFLSALFNFSSANADDYANARAELIAAYQAADYSAMLVAAKKTLVARPGYPGALFNLALTQTLNDDHQASLDTRSMYRRRYSVPIVAKPFANTRLFVQSRIRQKRRNLELKKRAYSRADRSAACGTPRAVRTFLNFQAVKLGCRSVIQKQR